jgi:hypothetical protein
VLRLAGPVAPPGFDVPEPELLAELDHLADDVGLSLAADPLPLGTVERGEELAVGIAAAAELDAHDARIEPAATGGCDAKALFAGSLEQVLEGRHMPGFDLLREPRVPEHLRVAGQHPEQRLAVIGVHEDGAAVLELAQVARVIRVDL